MYLYIVHVLYADVYAVANIAWKSDILRVGQDALS